MPIRRQWMTCVAAAILLVSAPASAQRPDSSEGAIKAAFLYNFTKFVEWPGSAFPQPSAAFVVCAFADGAFRKELETILQNEQVRGRRSPSRRRRSRIRAAATSPTSRKGMSSGRERCWRRCGDCRC